MNTKKYRINNNQGINYNMQGNKDVNIGNEINFNNSSNNNCVENIIILFKNNYRFLHCNRYMVTLSLSNDSSLVT